MDEQEFNEHRSTIRFDLIWYDDFGFCFNYHKIKDRLTSDDTERQAVIESLRALADELEEWGEPRTSPVTNERTVT